MVRFLTGLKVEEIGDGTEWRLLAPLAVEIDGVRHEVPEGFVTDFSSIPRIVRSIIPVLGRQNKASVWHDWCYVNQWPDKVTADRWFLRGMKSSGVWLAKRWVMHFAVVIGGGPAWRD